MKKEIKIGSNVVYPNLGKHVFVVRYIYPDGTADIRQGKSVELNVQLDQLKRVAKKTTGSITEK